MMAEHKLRNNIAIIITKRMHPYTLFNNLFLDASDNEFSKHHIIYSPLPDCRFGTKVRARILLQVFILFSYKTCVWTCRTSVTIKWRHRNNFAAKLQAQNIYVYNVQYNNTIVIMLSLNEQRNEMRGSFQNLNFV